jgi:hypothetical protein
MGAVWEFFGYRATDASAEALRAAATTNCPFLEDRCEKTLSDRSVSGVCAIKPATAAPVMCCPVRLYADDYRVLHLIAQRAFGPGQVLVPGPQARSEARRQDRAMVAVFGKRWGGELRLPKKSGRGNYYVDWILALVAPDGQLQQFVAVEVQTIDTTGSYRAGRRALLDGDRRLVRNTVGFNWENVSKRILPQLIYKGQLLQRERLCLPGLFFVCPAPVLGRILERLGGTLPQFPAERASITFLAYDYDPQVQAHDGQIAALRVIDTLPTSVDKLKESFSNVTLPESGVYQNAIEAALGDPGVLTGLGR